MHARRNVRRLAEAAAILLSMLPTVLAMGAQPQGILGRVLWHGLWMAALGIGFGLSLSLATSRILAGLLFEVKPADPATLASAAGLVAAVTLFASYLPARRASRVDPAIALRHE